jgi:hypothetical protein
MQCLRGQRLDGTAYTYLPRLLHFAQQGVGASWLAGAAQPRPSSVVAFDRVWTSGAAPARAFAALGPWLDWVLFHNAPKAQSGFGSPLRVPDE